MRIPRIQAASLALAGALAVADAAAANAQAVYTPGYVPGYAYGPAYTYSPGNAYGSYAYAPAGGFAYAASPLPSTTMCPPGYIYGKSAHASCFDPENGSDPDPRIGGSVKMNSSGDD